MHYAYQPHRVCSRLIEFDIENGTVHNVKFTGGCEGNLKAIGILIEGQPADKVISMLKGNQCGNRGTSCADQMALAMEHAINNAAQ